MATQDTELIVVDIGGGGGRKEPPAGGDGGGDGDNGRRPRKSPQRRYSTAIILGMISILVFFLVRAARAPRLLGGVAPLLYVSTRNFEKGEIARNPAAEITSYYWHFMDGLWVFLLLLLSLGR